MATGTKTPIGGGTLSVLSALDRLRLLQPAYRVAERVQAQKEREEGREDADGPVPSAELRVLVTGRASRDAFLRSGRRGAGALRGFLARNGVDWGALGDVLDFGCGCGRVARHVIDERGPRLHGAEYNGRLVEWCRRNLHPFPVSRSDLEPPLPFEDGSFDLVYGLSVLTHWGEELQDRWITEFARILRPQGHLVVSTHGDAYAERLSPAEREHYDAGRHVVRFERAAGSNICSAFHPRSYLEDRFRSAFELVDFEPSGARGNGKQDLTLLRRT